jgi:hypothetical protein
MFLTCASLSVVACLSAADPVWHAAPSALTTEWGEKVTPLNVWPEYPRPSLAREKWLNLNGLWEYAITQTGAAAPTAYDGSILVPFAIEAPLSGVAKPLKHDQTLWYRRHFEVPADWKSPRTQLNFGAVDWACTVRVNGTVVGAHTGGYAPFAIDITRALKAGDNELTVEVTDPTNHGGQPRGKQWDSPNGIWYTSTSGIWQTVWIEPLGGSYIRDARFHALPDGTVDSEIDIGGESDNLSIDLKIKDASLTIKNPGSTLRPRLKITTPHLWTPDDPFLYDVTMTIRNKDKEVLDTVTSYLAFREVTVGKDAGGVNRLLLNGNAVFQFGPLDQGFWPVGIYTPPSEEAMKFDLEAIKKMGCNMLRKHVKVESDRYYYWCDRMGLMVWQDIPSPFFTTKDFKDAPALTQEWKANFEREASEIIHAVGQHPSIVMWVPFNEGWGQTDIPWCKSVVANIKQWDTTRLVDNASGWTDMHVGDVVDIHNYPGAASPATEPTRAAVLGEFGGLGLPVENHTLLAKNNWGYKTYDSPAALSKAYVGLLSELPLLIGQGLSAAVYTQTTDVEIEVNGWLTYDRKVWKVDPVAARAAMAAVYAAPPVLTSVLSHAGSASRAGGEGPSWAYTFSDPGSGWEKPGFATLKWQHGHAGFGAKGTPGIIIGTPWTSPDIWLRREFTLAELPVKPMLALFHDEDADVYINDVLAAHADGYSTSYRTLEMSKESIDALIKGTNVIAIHCRQTSGGQGIDAGLVDLQPAKK